LKIIEVESQSDIVILERSKRSQMR